jgi:hypothetical protein
MVSCGWTCWPSETFCPIPNDKAVFDKAVDAIHVRYLPALAAAHAWFSGRMAE